MFEHIICMSYETLQGVLTSHIRYHYESPMELTTVQYGT